MLHSTKLRTAMHHHRFLCHSMPSLSPMIGKRWHPGTSHHCQTFWNVLPEMRKTWPEVLRLKDPKVQKVQNIMHRYIQVCTVCTTLVNLTRVQRHNFAIVIFFVIESHHDSADRQVGLAGGHNNVSLQIVCSHIAISLKRLTMTCWWFHWGTGWMLCSCPPRRNNRSASSKNCTSYSRSNPKSQPPCFAAKFPSGISVAMRWPCASGLPYRSTVLEGARCMYSSHSAWERLHGFWPR